MKKSKGITLIALAITIIVLLILAGVTISLVLGQQGVFTKAQEAKTKTEIANEKEQVQLAVLEAKTNSITDNTALKVELTKSVQKAFGDATKVEDKEDNTGYIIILSNGNKYEVDANGTIMKKEVPALSDELTYKEGTIEEGLVVTDMQGNEFVWIPVETPIAELESDVEIMVGQEKYPMAVKTVGTDKNGRQNYRGVTYYFEMSRGTPTDKVKITPNSYNPQSARREPAYLADTTCGDDSKYNTVGITKESIQEEFNTMVEKVKENKGFYVGRYETSYNGSKVESKQGKMTIDTREMWYGMYDKQKGLTNSGKNITSSMIWGSQWDQIMIMMKDEKNTKWDNSFYILNSDNMGNYSGNREQTGSSINYKVKNIYDLAGNAFEWTMEASNSNCRILRGGRCADNGIYYPAIHNGLDFPNETDTYNGSRLVLF